MGSVYVAHREDDPTQRAALKILDPDANVSSAEERFRREAEVLRNLDHPGIARFLHYVADPPVLVMEYIEGRDVKTRLEEDGAISPREAVHITRLVAEALTYLHARGVWHRDVKPANVLVDANGYIRLVDFGIAVEDDGASRLTQDGFFMGTLPYVPPEALDADAPDPASWDLYSLGVVLQEMLIGEPAFARATKDADRQGRGAVGQLLVAKDEWPYLDPGDDFDEELRALVRAMTANKAADRITLAEAGRRMMALRFPDEPAVTGEVPTVERTSNRPPVRAEPPTRERGMPLVPLLTAAGASGATLLVVVALAVVAMITVVTVVSLDRPDPEPDSKLAPELALQPADIEVVVAGVAADTPLAVRLAGREPDSRDGVSFSFAAVEPGLQTVSVMAGEQCQDDCLEGACPCCATRQQRTVVGASGPTLVVQMTPPATDCVAPDKAPEPARSPQTPRPVQRPRDVVTDERPPLQELPPELEGPEPVGALVSYKQFSGFIRDNRKWDQRRAVAKGMADAGYLADWRGSNPPVGQGEWPVVEVSFHAAMAFCEGRGGLARVDDGPHQWDVTPGQPIAELRQLRGGPAVRFSIGVVSTDVAPETTDARFGFRCRE